MNREALIADLESSWHPGLSMSGAETVLRACAEIIADGPPEALAAAKARTYQMLVEVFGEEGDEVYAEDYRAFRARHDIPADLPEGVFDLPLIAKLMHFTNTGYVIRVPT